MFSLKSSSARFAVLSGLTLLAAAVAKADSINVLNAGFELTQNPNSSEFGSLYPSQQLTDWTGMGYSFVFTSAAAATQGVADSYGTLALWGGNGLTASPDGGNFLGMDGAFEDGSISQRITGLTVGSPTTVSFYYAGAQQSSYNGATTESFKVSLGSQTLSTPILDNANHGFTGWQQVSLTFNPTSTSEVLTFLAQGTPNGEPPFTLLDGISVSNTVNAAPEPSSLALLGTGILTAGGLLRRRIGKK